MKCDKDCFNCKRPVSKCYGGDKKTAISSHDFITKTTVGKGTTFKTGSFMPAIGSKRNKFI